MSEEDHVNVKLNTGKYKSNGSTKWPAVDFHSLVTATDTTVGALWANTKGATS